MDSYRRLTPKIRYQIELLKGKNASNSAIAKEVGVSRSTITRELRLCPGVYVAEKAMLKSQLNSLERSNANRKIRGRLKKKVDRLLRKDWSPEQIEDDLSTKSQKTVSLKTIYRYVERDKLEGGRLKYHLRILRKQRKDRKKPKYRAYQGLVRDRVPISKRSKIVEKRSRVGDYERDTVLGKRGGAVLLTIVDRKTRYVHLACLERNSAELVHRATVNLLKREPIKTITNDNGTEFAYHSRTSRALDAPIYFSRSYRAWERGTNENTNGLLRQYFPKWKAIPAVSKKELLKIQNRLNSRPRKCLGFRTPHELYRLKPTGRLLR
jgi:transposase, IS30 family